MFSLNKKLSDLSSEKSEYNRSINQITLFTVTISSVLAFLYWILRYGFDDNSIFEIIKTLSVSYCLLLLPNFIYEYIRIKKKNQEESWFNSVAFISVLVLFVVFFLGLFSLLTGIKIIYLLLLLGFILLFLFLSDYFINFSGKHNIAYIILFILFAFWVGGLIWGTKYHGPLFYEKIIFGFAHPDILFYTAVSNLIKTFGFPSTGLDGLPYLHFHWGSNWLFAYLSGLINVSTIKFYNLCYPVIFIPFYFKNFLLFIVDFKRYKNFSPKLGLLLFALLFIVYIGRNTFSDLGNEAYLMAISFAFLFFSILISFWQNLKNRNSNHSTADKLFLFLLIPFFIGTIGLMKISVGFLLFGLYGYLFLRMSWHRKKEFFISFINSFLVFIIIYIATSNKSAIDGTITWFHLTEYIKSWNFFFSIDYLFLWIFIFIILYKEKITTFYELKEAFWQKKLLEIEVFLVIAILGLLPGAVLNIAGGSDWYFSNFQKLFGLGLVLSYLSYFTDSEEFLYFSWKKLKIGLVLIIFFITIDNISFIKNYYISTSQLVVVDIVIREKIINPDEINFSAKKFVQEAWRKRGFMGILKSAVSSAKLSQPGLSKLENYELIKILEKIGEMEYSEKRKTCIYIPKSNKIFWEMKIYQNLGHVRPFIVPAITGMAMIDGLPQGELPDIRDYYYYKKARFLRSVEEEARYDNIENIKSAARDKGFSQVIIIRQVGDNLIVEKI